MKAFAFGVSFGITDWVADFSTQYCSDWSHGCPPESRSGSDVLFFRSLLEYPPLSTWQRTDVTDATLFRCNYCFSPYVSSKSTLTDVNVQVNLELS